MVVVPRCTRQSIRADLCGSVATNDLNPLAEGGGHAEA